MRDAERSYNYITILCMLYIYINIYIRVCNLILRNVGSHYIH